MTERRLVGMQPWQPRFLQRWSWWNDPVPAARLAALRIGIAVVLLLDIATSYLPNLGDFFGRGSIGAPGELAHVEPSAGWHWSIFSNMADPLVFRLAACVWLLAALCLLLGYCARLAAALCWVLSVSFVQANPYVHNTGDTVRTVALFYLMLSPCAATCALSNRRRSASEEQIEVAAWPVRLLFVQLAAIYVFNGMHKLSGPNWPSGDALHYVLRDLTFTRWSYATLPVPEVAARLLTWFVLAWELSFPVLVILPRTRVAALCIGVCFHVGIWLNLEVGMFSLYMLCLYLPLVPWNG